MHAGYISQGYDDPRANEDILRVGCLDAFPDDVVCGGIRSSSLEVTELSSSDDDDNSMVLASSSFGIVLSREALEPEQLSMSGWNGCS